MPIVSTTHRTRRRPRQLRAVGFQPGQCPAVDSSFSQCLINGGLSPCSYIRECDQYTGSLHFEYALPFGTGNQNIWQISGDQAYWMGPAEAPPTPIFPDYVSEALTFANAQTLNPRIAPVPVVTQSEAAAANLAEQQAAAKAAADAAAAAAYQLQQAKTAEQKAAAKAAADAAAKSAADYAAAVAAQKAAAEAAAKAGQQNGAANPGQQSDISQFWKTLNIGSGTSAIKAAIADPGATLQSVPTWAWIAAAAGLYIATRKKTRSR